MKGQTELYPSGPGAVKPGAWVSQSVFPKVRMTPDSFLSTKGVINMVGFEDSREQWDAGHGPRAEEEDER